MVQSQLIFYFNSGSSNFTGRDVEKVFLSFFGGGEGGPSSHSLDSTCRVTVASVTIDIMSQKKNLKLKIPLGVKLK